MTADAEPLVSLPSQPAGVPWPTAAWPEAEAGPPGLDGLLDRAFTGVLERTRAVVVVHAGRLVASRYGADDGPGTLLPSWSMAKSVLQLLLGALVGDGLLDPDGPAGLPEWSAPGDPRAAITVADLLRMRDGLDFAEDYVDGDTSDAIAMLFGDGHRDVAAYAAARPLAAPPGERFSYSSGTTNLLSAVAARCLGPATPVDRFLTDRILGPIGASSAVPGVDEAGTWVASSFLDMTAPDFARVGLLALRGGVWDGRRLVPEGWVDRGRRPQATDPTNGVRYGEHWWVLDDGRGTFAALGYDGQILALCPANDTIVLRLGSLGADDGPKLRAWALEVVGAFDG